MVKTPDEMLFTINSLYTLYHVLWYTAQPRQRIELQFNKTFYIEASFECRFDHIEVRDGPFSFSPLINRFCGSANPGLVLSSGRFMWIRFLSDEELEGIGFQVQYSFTDGKTLKYISFRLGSVIGFKV